jgi:NhaC family Na+:H+ antiporter
MSKPVEHKEVGLTSSIAVFATILAIIMVGKLILGFDTALLLMIVSMFTSFVYVLCYKFTWDEMFEGGIIPMVARASGAIMILLTVGPMIAAWMISGTIPYIIHAGLQILTPKTFLVAAFIITAISSTLTGTSWGSAATFGVALMGIALGLGISPAISAGAIVAGSYFGDKLSPVSDTTVLAAATAEVDVIDHIRSMLWTTVPAFLLSIVIYFIIGAKTSGTIDMEQIGGILTAIENTFTLTPLVLIPPACLLVLAYMKKPTLPVLWIALVTAVPLAMMQGYNIPEIISIMAKGPDITTGVASVDNLLSRGGISFMAGAIAVIFFAYIFAGQLEYTGAFASISSALRDRFIKKNRGRLVLSMSLTGIFTGLGTGNSYLSEIVPGTMYRDLCDEMNVSRRVLSRTLEDSGTVVVPLIPWSAAGIYMATVLDVPVFSYAPWAFLLYLGFITAWIYGFTGIAIWPTDKKEVAK